MKTITLATLITLNLIFAADAQAQTAPPPAPTGTLRPMTPPAETPTDTRVTVDKNGQRTTVTSHGSCTTVKVCPYAARRRARRVAPKTPPQAPPPPPLAPAPAQAPPPPPAAQPTPPQAPRCGPAPNPVPVQAPKRPHLWDPANTRLGIMGTAEVLGHGQWEIASRGIVGLLELSVGLGDRFQLSFKTSPFTWFIPGPKQALWMGEVKAQIWRSPLFKLTGELSYFHVAGMHGLRPALSMKIGGDKVAFHAGLGTLVFIARTEEYDACAGPRTGDSYSYDCGGSTRSHHAFAVPHASLGLELRFWRYAKFFLEGFAAGGKDMPTTLGLVPGVRFHGKSFAADIGLGVLAIGGGMIIPLPVLNFSYRF